MVAMIDSYCAELADLILRAVDETALASTDFEERHGSPWNRNAQINYRQSTIRAALRAHPVLGVIEDTPGEWGRIQVIVPDERSPFLLKPQASLLEPDSGVQQHLPGFPADAPLLTYALSDNQITICQGQYRQVKRSSRRTEYQIVGELRVVWTNRVNDSVIFDQGADEDWMTHLDDHQEEEDGRRS